MLEPLQADRADETAADYGDEPGTRPKFTVAHIGILLFWIAYYVRPMDWVPGARTLPLAKVAASVAILGFLGALLGNIGGVLKAIKESKALVGLLVLYAWMCLAVPFAYWRGGSFDIVLNVYSEIIIIAALLFLSTTTPKRLRRVLIISILTAVVMSALAIKSFQTLGTNADESTRITGALGNVFSNPNDLALNVVILLPFCVVFGLLRKGIPRIFWLLCSVVMVGGILVSYSRAGFLALVVAAAVLSFDLGLRSRAAIILPLVLAVGLGAVIFLPNTFNSRVSTILHPSEDDTGSAQARKELLIRSIEVTVQHPLLGVGPGNFDSFSESWHGTHNIFTQLSAEAGIPALLIFIWILRCVFKQIKLGIAASGDDRELTLLLRASRASMVALIVSTFFYHAAFQFFAYFPIMYAAALFEMTRHRVPQTPQEVTEEDIQTDVYGYALPETQDSTDTGSLL